MDQFTSIVDLPVASGSKTTIGYDFQASFEQLAKRGEVDVAIVSTEDGYSPLGAAKRFFERDLQVSYEDGFGPLAEWNREKNPQITLVAIPSNNPYGLLRGIILAPGGNCPSYLDYVAQDRNAVDPTFYYQVTYQAIAHACRFWDARRLAMSHLSGSGRFDQRIATAQAQALAQFCRTQPDSAPHSFVFCGCCINPGHLRGIERMNEVTHGRLRPWPDPWGQDYPALEVEIEERSVGMLIHLRWERLEALSPTELRARRRRLGA